MEMYKNCNKLCNGNTPCESEKEWGRKKERDTGRDESEGRRFEENWL